MIYRAEDAFKKLGDFALIHNTSGQPWTLYNPWVEGDAIIVSFDGFEELIQYLEAL